MNHYVKMEVYKINGIFMTNLVSCLQIIHLMLFTNGYILCKKVLYIW
jgi:hypothetical protein